MPKSKAKTIKQANITFAPASRSHGLRLALPENLPQKGLSGKIDDLVVDRPDLLHAVDDRLNQLPGVGHRRVAPHDPQGSLLVAKTNLDAPHSAEQFLVNHGLLRGGRR